MSFMFAGDFFYNNGNVPIIVHQKLKEAIRESSAFIVNLEGPTVNKCPVFIQKVGPIKHQSDSGISVLTGMGDTEVSLANNRIMDGDRKGIEETNRIFNQIFVGAIPCYDLHSSWQPSHNLYTPKTLETASAEWSAV